MLRILRGFLAEIFITVLGLGAALIEAVFADERDVSLVLVVLTLLLTATTFAIRVELRNIMRDDLGRVLERIENPRWHEVAKANVDRLRAELQEWASGRRDLPGDAGLAYQVEVLGRTRESLDAIHLALRSRALRRWDKTTGEFNALVEAHERLHKKVRGRRLMVLDDDDGEIVTRDRGKRCLREPLVVRVCARQIRSRRDDGLGFDVRVLWKTDFRASHDRLPPDLLISDRSEAIVVKGISQEAGSNYYETEAYTNPVQVNAYQELFDEAWGAGIPVRQLLPTSALPRRRRRIFGVLPWFGHIGDDASAGEVT